MKTLNIKDFPEAKVGDILTVTVYPDSATSLHNAHRIKSIQKNGIIRVECVNPQCKKRLCTYLALSERELKTLKIDNTIKTSGRLGGMTL